METLPTIPLNSPGAAGLDRRTDVGDVDALALLDCDGLEIVAGPAGQGSRVRSRAYLRRWGQRIYAAPTLADTGAGAFAGTYRYRYVHTVSGVVRYSRASEIIASGAGSAVRVSGWGALGGTVAIYRTVTTGSTFKLVVAAHSDAGVYDDSTADGALGADFAGIAALVEPLGGASFDQTAFCDFLHVGQNGASSGRRLQVLIGNGAFYEGPPDVSEFLQTLSNASSPGAVPASVAALGDTIWVALGGSNLYYRAADTAVTGNENVKEGGLVAAEQPPKPTLSTATEGGVGTLTVVTGWQYVVQARDTATGIRSLPSDPVDTGAFASKLNVVLGYTNAAYSGDREYEIYRTSDGGAFFQYVGTSTSATSYTDTLEDFELQDEQVPFDVGASSGARIVFAHKGVLHTWDTDGRARWTSGLFAYNFPDSPDYEFYVGRNDGDEGTAAASWGEVALLFKRRRIYMLQGDPPDYRWGPVVGSDGFGCVAHRTVCQTLAGLMYLSPAGPCLVPSPGAAPIPIGDGLGDLLIEPQREGNVRLTATLSSEPAEITIEYTRPLPAPTHAATHIQVELDTDSAFGSADFTYETSTAAERPYFSLNGAEFPAAGMSLSAHQRVRIAVRPPTSAGPVAGTSYYVRYRVGTGTDWNAWVVLTATFTLPADDVFESPINWNKIAWAHAVHYPPRREYWLWVPTGSNTHSDLVLICSYAAMLEGGRPTWRMARIAATAATLIEDLDVDSIGKQTYLLIAGADGLLFVYPFVRDGVDHDTRVTVTDADRSVSATHASGTTLTASGTGWPTAQYGLKGTVVVARNASTGLTYTGLITANTATVLTVVWLNGRTPPAGTLAIAIGGLNAFLETGWFQLGPDDAHAGILRELLPITGPERASLNVEVRAARTARRALGDGVVKRLTLPCGRGYEAVRHSVDLRGHRHQLRIGTIAPKQRWEMQSLLMSVEATESRI